MPKSRSETEADLETFIKVWVNKVRRGKYIAVYARMDQLLVLVPGSSTDPIWYNYMSKVTSDEAEQICRRFELDTVYQATWDWEADRVRAKLEE
jgi:hypothetical protein